MNSKVRALARFALAIERRPWLFAVLFAVSDLLMYLTLAVLFTNHCPSHLRFVPELSDEFAAAVSDVYDFSLKLSVVIGIIMFIAPVVPLIFRRYWTVVIMLVLGIVVMKAGRGGLSLIPWSCRSALAEQMRVVRLNIARKAEAQRQGKTEWSRVPVHKFERRCGTSAMKGIAFPNRIMLLTRRYTFCRMRNGVRTDGQGTCGEPEFCWPMS